MQCSPTLTRVTGVTNCWRGLGKEKEEKQKKKTGEKVSSLHFGTEFGATGRKGKKNLPSRTRRAGGEYTPRAHEGERSKRGTLIMRDRLRE